MESRHFNGRYADVIAYDKHGQIVVLVEIKARHLRNRLDQEAVRAQLKAYLQDRELAVPFVMLVDFDQIQIFGWNGTELSEPLSSFAAEVILRRYDPEFGQKQIFEFYLATLVEAWLRDLAYHWKSEELPEAKQLAAIGLLDKLVDGTTQSEVALGRHSLR